MPDDPKTAEALRLADDLDTFAGEVELEMHVETVNEAAAHIRSQHAKIERLRADVWTPLLLGRKADPMPATHAEVDLTLSTGAVVPGSWLGSDIGWDWDDTDDPADAEANVIAWRPRPTPYKRPAAPAADADQAAEGGAT